MCCPCCLLLLIFLLKEFQSRIKTLQVPQKDLYFFPAFDAKLLYNLSWHRAFRMQLSLCKAMSRFAVPYKMGQEGILLDKGSGGEVLPFKHVLKPLMFQNSRSNICLKNFLDRLSTKQTVAQGYPFQISILAALQLSQLQLVMKEENFSSFLNLLSHPMMIKPAGGLR